MISKPGWCFGDRKVVNYRDKPIAHALRIGNLEPFLPCLKRSMGLDGTSVSSVGQTGMSRLQPPNSI